MDMSDPWWQSAFVEKALAKAKSSCESFGMSQETPCDDNSKHDDSLNAFLWHKELEAADVEASEVQSNKKWLDNISFQRENYRDSCDTLGINYSKPRIAGMRRSVELSHWQPVAMQALVEFQEKAYCQTSALPTISVGSLLLV
ncbi:uncharacterized protein ARB_01555 [Trichophyton benhamiae CBS 112371]|uniref:Uncharacterized protein n=1 Tax=Arthroderma benhamiae (strain ATCC MYA-4681 / CBS 112371) TaxID=663331 RepID=D4AZD5_ARTBC|nr:uncharacterized protein ARB_01555 [Trichophyton benhamiae CBS 112371]EFE31655.1 hypothetical protein ARB_01555 [Trichophyton benhamiae CBS 112371]